MGIQGLIPLLERASKNTNISELSGLVAAVDVYVWIHRACYGCGHKIYLGEETNQYVEYCLNRAQMLMRAGIKPILVFDGQNLPAKKSTDTSRQMTKHNIKQRINLFLSEGNDVKAKELMRSCVEVTQEMANKVMKALRDNHIDYIVAPYEADAQLAYLVNNGFADFVITEDSDLLVYNCRLCFFKMDSNGNGKLVDLSLMNQCLGNSFNVDKFRHMCILSGCDYLPNISGIGLQKAKKFFEMTANNDLKKSLFKVPNYLKMTKRVKVTQEYVDDFIKADNTFKYQLVFCPIERKLVPLTPYDHNVKVEELTYAGNYFGDHLSEDFAFQFAIGNVDINTLKIIDSYELNHKSNSIWSKDWINHRKNSNFNKAIQKLNSKVGDESQCNQRTNTHINETPNIDKSNKRLKVDETRFTTHIQLLKEYSFDNNRDTKSSHSLVCSSTKRETHSRNIFKVVNESTEDKALIQSKYFADLKFKSNSITESVHNNELVNTNTVFTQSSKILLNSSQYSLNSSGNTNVDSSFGDTSVMSDTERSEISETSDEENSAIDISHQIVQKDIDYTSIKSTKNNAIKRMKPLNISFNSQKTPEISSYFK